MRTARFTTLAGLFLLLFLCAERCRADQVLYMSGTVVTVGNSASNCNPNPCTIVTNFNFQIDYRLGPDIFDELVLGAASETVTYTTLSSLGNSSGVDIPTSGLGLAEDYPLWDQYLVIPGFPGEVDLDFGLNQAADGTLVPEGASVQWYYCGGTCIEDFIQPQYQQDFSPAEGCYNFSCEYDASSIQLLGLSEVVAQTPEASSLVLLGFGACLVLAAPLRRTSHTRRA